MDSLQKKIAESEEYKLMTSERRRLVWPLLILVIGIYMAFILAIAFTPSLLGQSINGSVISVGILTGLCLIIFIFAVTFYYVHCANKKIEPLITKLHAMGEDK